MGEGAKYTLVILAALALLSGVTAAMIMILAEIGLNILLSAAIVLVFITFAVITLDLYFDKKQKET